MRYVFFRYNPHTSYPEEPAFFILDHIGYAAIQLDLFQRIPANRVFYRGRMHQCKDDQFTEETLCSPPSEVAQASRMSAEGISVFYAANDIKTTIAEIYRSNYPYATVAQFKNLRELLLLDLTRISDLCVPSLFDSENRSMREPIKFLRSLNADLIKPIESLKRIEYIPAQIVTEYFRFLFTLKGERLDGIAYSSSKSKDGICYVLFFDHEQCLPSIPSELFYNKHKREIRMNPNSVYTYSVWNDIRSKQINPTK